MTKLSPQEKRILAAASLNAELDLGKVAEEAGVKNHVARYALRKLLEQGVISTTCYVNGSLLGFERYQLSFAFSPTSSDQEKLVLENLFKDPRVFWVIEVAGEFRYQLGVYARNTREISDFVEEFYSLFGEIIWKKEISTLVRQINFGRKYLSPEIFKDKEVDIDSFSQQYSIDELDARILEKLTNQYFSSWLSISKALEIPPSTLDARVQKLKRAGVIMRIIYSVKPSSLQREQYRILIVCSGPSSEIRTRVQVFCRKHPDIVSMVEFIGARDFEIRLECLSSRDASNIRQEIVRSFGNKLSSILLISQVEELKLNFFQSASLLKIRAQRS